MTSHQKVKYVLGVETSCDDTAIGIIDSSKNIKANIVLNQNDLSKKSKDLASLERKITVFHAEKINHILLEYKKEIDLIGFHGQTIFHNPQKKITKQLGDGKLLSQLSKKKVIYNFRQNDLKMGGQGAPLTPIFHSILVKQKKIPLPVVILNIGGITNYTFIDEKGVSSSLDLGPGNCLIDQWVRLNSKKKYDKNGSIAKSGKIKKIILLKSK